VCPAEGRKSAWMSAGGDSDNDGDGNKLLVMGGDRGWVPF